MIHINPYRVMWNVLNRYDAYEHQQALAQLNTTRVHVSVRQHAVASQEDAAEHGHMLNSLPLPSTRYSTAKAHALHLVSLYGSSIHFKRVLSKQLAGSSLHFLGYRVVRVY